MAVSLTAGIPAIANFDPESDPASLGPRWKAWRDRLAIYLSAAGVKDDDQQRALLLHLGGEALQREI